MILLLSATPQELAPFLNHPEVTQGASLAIGGRLVTECRFHGKNLLALATGPGAVNTAMGLAALLETREISRIMQIGCAGGFGRAKVRTGDVAIATEEIDVHLGLEREEDPQSISPLPFSVMEKEGKAYRNRYLLNREMADKASEVLHQSSIAPKKGFSLHKGSFISASTITTTTTRANTLFELYCPVMESMEGAAAAHTAIHYNTPLLEIRAASNLVGPRNRESWELASAFNNSCLCLIELLKK
ncbi:MAG: futalosine hydrolase [Desulfobacterales bacterium]|nr:futalosine hydrolase [Desulfobacterales bacterium]